MLSAKSAVRDRVFAALFVAVGTAIVLLNWLLKALASPQRGWDFPVFYIAAKLPIRLLYDRAAFAAVWRHDLAPLGVPHWAPYVRLSFFAVVLHPLGSIPYSVALWFWMGAEVVTYLAAVGLLVRRFRLPAFFIPASAAFFPALAGIISGQDNAVYLLAFVATFLLLERKRDLVAGLILAVCLCKYNLAILVPVVLIAHRRHKALFSFSVAAIAITALSFTLTSLSSYLFAIAHAQSDTAGFFPVGLRGFSAAIGQPWCYPFLAALFGVATCWLIVKLPLAEGMCVAITGALMTSPYVTWYDSTLLVIPLAILFSYANPVVRWSSLAVLVAMPLWEHGGGNNGPSGFMHVAIEVFLLGAFLVATRRFGIADRARAQPEVASLLSRGD